MKRRLLLLLLASCFATHLARAHGAVDLGPNKGRLLEFSRDKSVRGEIVLKEGEFRVGLLDKDLKPLPIATQSLAVITGDRDNPTTLKVEVKENQFAFPQHQKEKHHLILRYRVAPDSLPVTVRVPFDPSECSGCKQPEWLCTCE
jgi:hypothetical protein